MFHYAPHLADGSWQTVVRGKTPSTIYYLLATNASEGGV